MSKGKATVITPDGIEHARRTDRPYQYAVAYVADLNQRLRYVLTQRIPALRRQIGKYENIVERGVVPAEYSRHIKISDYVRYLADTRAGLIESEIALAALPNEQRPSPWAVISYHSTERLARKQAAANATDPYMAVLSISVIPVVLRRKVKEKIMNKHTPLSELIASGAVERGRDVTSQRIHVVPAILATRRSKLAPHVLVCVAENGVDAVIGTLDGSTLKLALVAECTVLERTHEHTCRKCGDPIPANPPGWVPPTICDACDAKRVDEEIRRNGSE